MDRVIHSIFTRSILVSQQNIFFGVTKPHFQAFINTFYPAAPVISFTASAYKGGT